MPMYGEKAILVCRSRLVSCSVIERSRSCNYCWIIFNSRVMARLFSEGTLQWNMLSGTRRSSSPPPTPRCNVKKKHNTGEAFEFMAGYEET